MERDGLAAEFALGALSGVELRNAQALAASDAEFARLVAEWEQRLSPLASALAPVSAPAGLREKVMAALPPPPAANDNVFELRKAVQRWKRFSALATAMAAALAGALVLRPALQPTLPDGGRYVAVLQSEGPGPAFVASVDVVKGTISVRTVAAQAPAGKSYELWAIGAGREKPQSLGVIDASYKVPANVLGKVDEAALGDTLFAVTLEQQGGSPTGQPTSAPVFTGKLIATE
jgi:anti-sigma-K factor RskA